MTKIPSLRRQLGVFVLLALAGCGGAQKPASSPEWDQFVAGYLDSYFAAHPDAAVSAGRHEFDGKLPDFSRSALDKEIARLHAARIRAQSFATDLDSRQQFERDYVLSAIDTDLFWLEWARSPYRNPFFYSDPLDPQVYLTRPYAPLDQRMRAFIAYERALPAALLQVRANLQTPMPRTLVDFGRTTFGGLATYFAHDVPGIFASVKDTKLQSDFAAANADAVKALVALDAWLASLQSGATDNFERARIYSKKCCMTPSASIPRSINWKPSAARTWTATPPR